VAGLFYQLLITFPKIVAQKVSGLKEKVYIYTIIKKQTL